MRIEVYTTAAINKPYQYCGFVSSCIVKARNVFSTSGSAFKAAFGGKLGGQTKLIEAARNEVISNIVAQAERLGANAIIGLRIDSDSILEGFLQFVAYGTAVKFQ